MGGTEVKEGFETSPEEGRGGGGPDRMYFFPPLFRSLLLLADLGRRSCWDTPTMTLTVVRG